MALRFRHLAVAALALFAFLPSAEAQFNSGQLPGFSAAPSIPDFKSGKGARLGFGSGSLPSAGEADAPINAPGGPMAPLFGAEPEEVKIDIPGITEYAPSDSLGSGAADTREIVLEARLTPEGGPLEHGLIWRVFEPVPGPDGTLPLVATSKGGTARFDFPPGDYFVHVAFGRAGITRKLTIPPVGAIPPQSVVLDAGGLVLSAVSGRDMKIPSAKLRFSIYAGESDDESDRKLVAKDVKPGTLVRLNAGIYHVVSNYGGVNATIRADIRVEAGKLTEATLQHRAAQLTLKLVSEEGGEAIADTAWSILTSSGDIVSESVGAFPSLVLAEGEYTAIARNKGKLYQRDFEVVAGRNMDVEVLMAE